MHTNFVDNSEVAIFFFAHQDDEFGVFQSILNEQQARRKIVCVYLTNGVVSGKKISSEVRNSESRGILKKINVQMQDVYFAGDDIPIKDGKLPQSLKLAETWIGKWIEQFSNIRSIYTTAWEGGHQDHDALYALVVNIATKKNLLHCVKQFSLYNSFRLGGPFFRVLSPLQANGKIESTIIPWANRFRFLTYCLSYTSQMKTWLGLFPFVFFHYLFFGKQYLQSVSIEIIEQRPHEGKLYYEKRNFFTWKEMQEAIKSGNYHDNVVKNTQ